MDVHRGDAMSATVARRPTAVDVAEARRLHKAGWNSREIASMLATNGVSVSDRAVCRWVNPHLELRDRLRHRAYQAQKRAEGGAFTLRGSSIAYRAAFIRRLYAEAVPINSIAKVCRVVFGDAEIDRYWVDQMLDADCE